MSGRGEISEAVPIKTAHIYTLRNGRWYKFFRPINPDREMAGVNLAESFAEAYVKRHECDVGLIACADGGTSLNQWMPGEVLFENAVNCARLAQRSSTIVGILWHQGEADCAPHLTATYRERFTAMITELKERLGLKDVPVLIGGLGDFLEKRDPNSNLIHYRNLNKELMKIADGDPLTAFVPADGLCDKGDNLHFNSRSLYEFGLRYFDAFEKFDITANGEGAADPDALKLTEMELL